MSIEDEHIVKADGFDDCIIGCAYRENGELVAVYDEDKILGKIMAQGMEEFEAKEFYVYNIVSCWMGDKTPLFVFPIPEHIEVDLDTSTD